MSVAQQREEQITAEQARFFQDRFEAMDSEELIDIHRKGGLLPGAEAILLDILQDRGVTEQERTSIAGELRANSYHEQFAHMAPIGSRFMARFIDTLVAFGVGAIGVIVVSIFDSLAGLAAGLSLFILYKLLADTMPNGQSIGKRMNDIAVVSLKTGAACSPIQSIARNVLLVALGIIDVALILGESHRRIGDRLAGTIVVKREPK